MFKYFPLGDSSFLIKVGDIISVDIHKQIRALLIEIKNSKIDGIIELVPAYNELMLVYDPLKVKYKQLIASLQNLENKLNTEDIISSDLVHIPVCYENDFAPDLNIVAQKNNLTSKQVVKIHTTTEYLVYMLGFTPGFCYLGGMDERISTPRKESPRQLIEAGSVGIAGNQTGIYPIDSPGGWQIIGKSPILLFDPNRNPEFLIHAGDYIKFDSISKSEFEKIVLTTKNGNYNLLKEKRDA